MLTTHGSTISSGNISKLKQEILILSSDYSPATHLISESSDPEITKTQLLLLHFVPSFI